MNPTMNPLPYLAIIAGLLLIIVGLVIYASHLLDSREQLLKQIEGRDHRRAGR